MTASAHILRPNSVTRVMLLVLACLLPGVFTYAWQFGWGILINLVWASLLALAIETIALKLRAFPVKPFLLDGSAIVTAWLLALSLPPLAPWWLMLVGMIFAIGVAKHLYGGLGQNIFNPAMVGFAVAAIPGRIPLALGLLLQPLDILTKAAAVAAVVLALRLLLRLLLRQWRSSPNVPAELQARRQQRYLNLLQAGQRLLSLAGVVVLMALVISGIPGLAATPVASWLAGGAVLGALALVFQGLLRDFAAGVVVLIEDHYAVGDWVQVDALEGTVEDVGILTTALRALDQRVVVIPNSRCEQVVNHTRIRSGVELVVPLPPRSPQLERVLSVLAEECVLFAAKPEWKDLLLEPPLIRGVKRITPLAVELSVLLITRTGAQWAAERALLTQIVARMEREALPLAQAEAMIS